MKQNLVLGTLSFALLSVVIGLAMQIAIEWLGAPSGLAGQISTFMVAIPVALIVARCVGRLTRLSVLVASFGIVVVTFWGIVFLLNSVAEPAGGHVGWASLFSETNWRGTISGGAAMLVVPQLWLLVLNRLAVDNAHAPFRDAA